MVTRPVPASAALPPETASGPVEGGLPETGMFWRTLLEDVADAVLLQDAEGSLRWSNHAAAELFPDGKASPEPVVEGDGTGRIEHGTRRFRARFRELPEGWRAWTVPVTTEPAAGLRVEEFLAGAGLRLSMAKGRHGTARLIADLAAADLADCVFVLLPTTRGRWEWWSCDRAGNLGHGRIRRAQPELTPVIARTFSATGAPEAWTVPQAEVAMLPAIVADRLEDQDQVSVVSLGLEGGAGATGAVLLGRRGAPAFGDGQYRAIADFARSAGTALANAQRYTRQEEATRGLETTLHPTEPPAVDGARFEIWYEPSGGPLTVGGDFYDVLPREDGSALVVLGDICGNGAEAAALTGRVRHSLAALHLVERDGPTLLRQLNQLLISSGSSRFATLVLGSMARSPTGGLRLTLASGGHPAPLVVRRSGGVEEVSLPGTLVGISPQARFAEAVTDLEEGDICLLYTDGITEARSLRSPAELYGDERLHDLLETCCGESGKAVVQRVREAMLDWLGTSGHDDIAVLAIECVARDA